MHLHIKNKQVGHNQVKSHTHDLVCTITETAQFLLEQC